MSRNRKKYDEGLKVSALLLWLIVAAFLGVVGLCYVSLKNQLCATGTQITKLERELGEITTRNDVARAKISSLSSRAVLQRRLNEKFITMLPISDEKIVHINAPQLQSEAGEIRAVSNEGLRK